MKKLVLLMAMFALVLTLSACSDLCIGAECIIDVEDNADPIDPVDPVECPEPEEIEGTVIDNAIFYNHIDGYGIEDVDHISFILFEEEMRDFVKYQVTYLSCTCRAADENFWQVAYFEINKYTNDISTLTFGFDDPDSNHPYTAGMWGDSSPTPTGKTTADFTSEFIPWLIGQSTATLDGISVFVNGDYHGIENTKTIPEQDLIDDYASSSVSTNNMIRIAKSLLEYHDSKY